MTESKHFTPTILAYANALLELATKANDAPDVGSDLLAIKGVLDDNPSFGAFLSSPAVGAVEQMTLLKKVLASQATPLLMNFIHVLSEHGRLSLLARIADAYSQLLDEQLGKIEVDVTVAKKLSDEELENVRQRVSKALKRDAVVYQEVDETLIGGLLLRIGDRLIDASVKNQLKNIREQMLASAPRQEI